MLTSDLIKEFRKQLKSRYRELRGEIHQAMLQSDNQRFIDLAGEVHDLEDASVADLLVDLDLAILDLHIDEVRDIDSALMRIAAGEYGVCATCDDDIGIERLRAHPTAKRCRPCQSSYESNHAGRGRPSL